MIDEMRDAMVIAWADADADPSIEGTCDKLARAAYSVIAGKVAELVEALEAIDKTTFIGATTDSHETRQVALESAHDIARAALAPYPERRSE